MRTLKTENLDQDYVLSLLELDKEVAIKTFKFLTPPKVEFTYSFKDKLGNLGINHFLGLREKAIDFILSKEYETLFLWEVKA